MSIDPKSRAILALRALLCNPDSSPMIHRSYVEEKLQTALCSDEPEWMLDEENMARYSRFLSELTNQ